MLFRLIGAETVPVASVPRPASEGSSASNWGRRWQPCGPPLADAATVANGVPKATCAAASWAAVSLEKPAAVRQTVSNCARCAVK